MSDTMQNPEHRSALFQRKEIRRTIHNNEWWFVITDIVAALTDPANPPLASASRASSASIAPSLSENANAEAS